MKNIFLAVLLVVGITSCSEQNKKEHPIEAQTENVEKTQDSTILSERPDYKTRRKINRVDERPVIDGLGNDSCWANAEWRAIDQVYLGDSMAPGDFNGRFKMMWDESALFLLVEVIDDSVRDMYEPWDTVWWYDDCVEIFIDENNSLGKHQFSHNAFAYHVGLNYDVVDLGPDKKPHLYNNHINAKRTVDGNKNTWEFAMKVFGEEYNEDGSNTKQRLTSGRKMGFMIAYCDGDSTAVRENFIGSEIIKGEDKDRGWIDAGEFGEIELVD